MVQILKYIKTELQLGVVACFLSFSGAVMDGLECGILPEQVFAYYEGVRCEVLAESPRRKANELRLAHYILVCTTILKCIARKLYFLEVYDFLGNTLHVYG